VKAVRTVFALCLLGLSAALQAAPHVLLVSIDGLRPEFYLDSTWPAPTLQMIAHRGATARRVRGVYPSVTYPSHTTLITGALPARHGIFYNAPFAPEGNGGAWYWYSKDIRVPTLWDAARTAGRATAALGWPVTVGAPVDFLLPEIWPLDSSHNLLTTLRENSYPPTLLADLERGATGPLQADSLSLDHLDHDLHFAAMAAWLIREKHPDLLAIHFVEADHFQHQEGRQGTTVKRALAAIDASLTMLCQALIDSHRDASTSWVITGDHGFLDRQRLLAPNVWLRDAGLLQALPGHGDWKAVFHVTGAAAFLHIKDSRDQASVQAVRRLLAKLPDSQRSLFTVLGPDDLARLHAAPEAALALDPIPGVDVTDRIDVPVLSATHGGQHGYRMRDPGIFTGLVAAGPGIRVGRQIRELNMQDIAPLVARLLDVKFHAPDGKLPSALLDPDAQAGVCGDPEKAATL